MNPCLGHDECRFKIVIVIKEYFTPMRLGLKRGMKREREQNKDRQSEKEKKRERDIETTFLWYFW